MYRRLGVEVALLQRSPLLLPDWEPEISLEARGVLEEEGVHVAMGVQVKEVRKGGDGGGNVVVTNLGEVEGDEILVVTGRRPNVDLNLTAAGVELNERGGIRVDEELRTSNPDIYAVGDVLGGRILEALAEKQGSITAENTLSNSHRKVDMLSVPRSVFIQPNAAGVGLTEAEASKLYYIKSRVLRMEDVAKAKILGETRGLVKMIVDSGNWRIFGVHLIGENGAEVVNEAALALRLRTTVYDLVDTVHVFPTMVESLKLVAQSFFRDVRNMSCCVD
jgi:mercuric reductase